jgi:hypothetical protein
MPRAANYNFLDRFWARVDVRGPEDCWEWTGFRFHDNYGGVGYKVNGRTLTPRAHVISLFIASGQDAGGRYALHHCDNPPCCNPAHLYWGSQRQNIADMDSRGRANRPVLQGVQQAKAKLTDADVVAIRAAYAASGVTQQVLAAQSGVSQFAISSVIRRAAWSHVP